jgi:hypothetical protein
LKALAAKRAEIAGLQHADAELESALERRDAQLSAKNQQIACLRRLADVERAGAERATKKRRGAADSAAGSLSKLGGELNMRLVEVKQVLARAA